MVNKVVLLLDTSGSTAQPTKAKRNGEDTSRISLLVHVTKMILSMCEARNVKCVVYRYASTCTRIVEETDTLATATPKLDAIRPDGMTEMTTALKTALSEQGPDAAYILITDGEPTSPPDDYIREMFASTWLNLVIIGNNSDTGLMKTIAERNIKNSIVFFQDIRGSMGYMLPLMAYIFSDGATLDLTKEDDDTRLEFTKKVKEAFGISQLGYQIKEILAAMSGASEYVTDLKRDLVTDPDHAKIQEGVSTRNNFLDFGKFYIPTVINAHQKRIPLNTFDVSFKHYMTPEFNAIMKTLLALPQPPFVTLTAAEDKQAAASALTNATSRAAVSYDQGGYTYDDNDNDGCIVANTWVQTGPTTYRQAFALSVGDLIRVDETSYQPITHIVVIEDLGRGKFVMTYNGLTPSHPVQMPDGSWGLARDYPLTKVAHTMDTLYDFVTAGSTGKMYIRPPLEGFWETGKYVDMAQPPIVCATLGVSQVGVEHPYYGTQKVIDDIKSKVGETGVLHVQGKDIRKVNDVVVSIIGE